jgi:hypothetical protein
MVNFTIIEVPQNCTNIEVGPPLHRMFFSVKKAFLIPVIGKELPEKLNTSEVPQN